MAIPEYSIVIPNLHSPGIGDVLDALRRQDGVDRSGYEILVVGRDKYGLVRRHEAEDKRIRFLESERDLNPAEARNRGIKEAKGSLIFFIDADCIAMPRWMAALLESYKEGNPVVGGPIWFERDRFWVLCDNVAHFHDLLPDIGRGVNRHFMLATANMLIEKAILEKVGMFDESFPRGQDFELSMKVRHAGYHLFFEPEAYILHRPVRDTLEAVLSHSAAWARHSIRIRTKYRDTLKTPWILFSPMTLRLFSPFIALAVMSKIFVKHPSVRCYWYTAPVVFLTKLVWCWAAAAEVAAGRHKQGIEKER
ncbi:MAG: glycosyltransferase [Nitrospirae bacterium]|nr:glycosyltransferase [Nitrospirota bacterium]